MLPSSSKPINLEQGKLYAAKEAEYHVPVDTTPVDKTHHAWQHLDLELGDEEDRVGY